MRRWGPSEGMGLSEGLGLSERMGLSEAMGTFGLQVQGSCYHMWLPLDTRADFGWWKRPEKQRCEIQSSFGSSG